MKHKILILIFLIFLLNNYIIGKTNKLDKFDKKLDKILDEIDNTDDKNTTNDQESEQKKQSKKPDYISLFEFGHQLPFSYLSGQQSPGFMYELNFNFTQPFLVEKGILTQSKFNAKIYNAVSISFDKLGTSLSLTPLLFIDILTGYSIFFIWTINQIGGYLDAASSFDDKDTRKISGIGHNVDIGLTLKFPFQMFFPKVKLVFIDKSIFSYWFFPGIDFWKTGQLNIILKDGWIFNNNFMIMWAEQIFRPFLSFNLTHYFIRPDNLTMIVGGGIIINIEKANLFINANAGVYVMSPEFAKRVKVTILIRHTFARIKVNKKSDL